MQDNQQATPAVALSASLMPFNISPSPTAGCSPTLTKLAASRAMPAAGMARSVIPAEDIAFIASFEDQIRLGDYLFVHAGVRPDVPLNAQRSSDLRWIRDPFLDHDEGFGAVVVHGHTIFDCPQIRHNRIGIDTGAYRSDRLTALGLEGTNRWLLTSAAKDGAIRVKTEE